MDHYATLGVAKNATPEEIKKAYRKLASKHHPDKGGDTALFQQVEEAYRILSDPIKKSEYDNPKSNFNFNFNNQEFDLNDVFSQFGFGPHFRPRQNKDIRVSIELSIQDILSEQKRTLNIKTSNSQSHRVDITIPAGITSGTIIKYPNLGDDMFPVLPRGALLVQVNIINHTDFEVNGLDLIKTLTINCFDAILGSEQTVMGLDGKQFVIRTPIGCQPDTKLKIPGEGLPAFRKDIKGNLYVKVKVSIPKDLTPEQIELINKVNNPTNQ